MNYGVWVEIPTLPIDQLIRAKLKITKSFKGLLKGALFRGEGFYLYGEREDNSVFNFKIVPKNAEDGIWLNPFSFSPETNYREPCIKRIKIVCLDQEMADPSYTLALEQFNFNGVDLQDFFLANANKDVYRFFN